MTRKKMVGVSGSVCCLEGRVGRVKVVWRYGGRRNGLILLGTVASNQRPDMESSGRNDKDMSARRIWLLSESEGIE